MCSCSVLNMFLIWNVFIAWVKAQKHLPALNSWDMTYICREREQYNEVSDLIILTYFDFVIKSIEYSVLCV